MKINILGRQADIKTEFVIIASAVLILLGCLTGYLFFRDTSDIIIENDGCGTTADMGNITQGSTDLALIGNTASVAANMKDKTPENAGISTPATRTGEASINKADMIKVYVVGCVKNPGIVILEKGQVIDDAVKKAGGLTDEADAAGINMVYELNENTMLYIKSKNETEPKSGSASNNETAKASGSKTSTAKPSMQAVKTQEMTVNQAKSGTNPTIKKDEFVSGSAEARSPGKGAVIIEGSGSGVEIIPGGTMGNRADGFAQNGKNAYVNINTADIAELDKLPGIGEATAREIIAYREKNGPFLKIEDIMKVPRIKQGRFDSIKDMITVN